MSLNKKKNNIYTSVNIHLENLQLFVAGEFNYLKIWTQMKSMFK